MLKFQEGTFHVGALVLTNMGKREELIVAGRPIGDTLTQGYEDQQPGSVIILVATDLPLNERQLKRQF